MLLSCSRSFEPAPFAPAQARRFADEMAEDWGFVSTDLALVVGELAVNAVVHVGYPFTVALSCDGRRMTVEVTDPSFEMPVQQTPRRDSLTGRGGLAIVAALSSDWGVRFSPGGKVVWAELTPDQ